MSLKRVNIYKDAKKYLTLLKYMGLTTYSLPKRGQQRLTMSVTNVAIVVLALLAIAVTLISCNLYCILDRKLYDAIGIIAYVCLDLEIVAVVICSHLQSSGLVEIFRKFKAIDRKLLKFTESSVLIVKTQRIDEYVSRLKSVLPILAMFSDAGLLYNVMGLNVPLGLIFCMAIPHISNLWRSQSGSLYIFFISECTARVEYINNAIEGVLLLKQRIACIETSIAPKPNACYKLDEAKHVMSNMLDVVTKINKTFELHLLIKSVHISAVLLLVAYYAGNFYLLNKNTSAVTAVVYCLYLIAHGIVQLLDLLIDIWFYKKLQHEVSIRSYSWLYKAIIFVNRWI